MTKNTMKYFNRLIGKIAVKDEKALEALYDIYGKLIYVTAMTVTKSTFKADEIVDDVLVKIWKNADKLPKIKNPEGWLYSMTVNCAKDKIKCEKQYVELFDLQEDGSVGDYPEDDFYNKISTLDETEQEIMILKFVDDLTFKKIAKAMGKPLSTITSVYYHALEKLK